MSKKSTKKPISKKEQFIETPKTGKSFKPFFLMAGLVCLLIGAGVLWYSGIFAGQNSGRLVAGSATQTASTGNNLAFDSAEFADGKARHYSYTDPSGLNIKFFLLKSSDGVIRAAFDACDVCWRSGLGYHQEGDNMVCGNCGLRFASTRINEVKGGCNPAPLNRRLEGNQVIISVPDILAGRSYFNI